MWLLGGLAVVGGVMTVVVVSQGVRTALDSRALGGVATMFAAGGLGFVYLWLWQRNARLLVGVGVIGFQDILRRRHTWAAAEIGSVVDVAIAYTKSGTPQRAVFFLGLNGRRLLSLNSIAWARASVDRLVEASGKPLDLRTEAVPAVEFRREFPKALPWVSAHSTVAGALLGLGLIIVAIGAAIFLLR